MVGAIIVGVILFYAGVVVYKKVKDMRAGKFCSCGCEGCPSKTKCHE